MRRRSLVDHLRLAPILILPALALACDGDGELAGPEDASGLSVAYSRWTPGPTDTCTREVHDSYAVVGPDGKLYPTWHPPVDPASGCTFGHEHGRDPRDSDLYAQVGPMPFGLANDALDAYDPGAPRHEDHVGHKIEWENDFVLDVGGGGAGLIRIVCDVLTKLHQGSHSKDAFTNNLHEIVYHIRCSDGTGFSTTFLAAIGGAGELVASCDRDRHIEVGTPSPANSPSGGGRRAIPDRQCVEQHVFVGDERNSNFNTALRESWEVSGRIQTADKQRTLVSFSPYFQVLAPSRYYDATQANGVGRSIDLCYEVMEDGRRAHGGLCEESTGNGVIADVSFDSPQSRFDGVRRFVDINSNRVRNEGGPEVWYSDPFGKNARTEPFAGSIRQWIASIDNSALDLHGPVIGRDRDYGHPSVHAPN